MENPGEGKSTRLEDDEFRKRGKSILMGGKGEKYETDYSSMK